jgi:hypothetical protein
MFQITVQESPTIGNSMGRYLLVGSDMRIFARIPIHRQGTREPIQPAPEKSQAKWHMAEQKYYAPLPLESITVAGTIRIPNQILETKVEPSTAIRRGQVAKIRLGN